MDRILVLAFMTFFTAAMVFSPEKAEPAPVEGCIVMPEVIQSCVESGGRFDYGICSCVGGSGGAGISLEQH